MKKIVKIDDLIMVYCAQKIRLGYEPSFSSEEFMSFLYFFEESTKIIVMGNNYKNEEIFERFFKVNSLYWDNVKLRMQDGIIYPTYNLSNTDINYLDVCFLSSDVKRIVVDAITKFLEGTPKRTLVSPQEFTSEALTMGNDTSAALTYLRYPEVDNQSLINEEMYGYYEALSKGLAAMYQNSLGLRVSNVPIHYLAFANYTLLTDGLEPIPKAFYLDIPKHALWYADRDEVGTNRQIIIHGEQNQRLVRSLDSFRKKD